METKDRSGLTALEVAVQAGSAEAIDALVSVGAAITDRAVTLAVGTDHQLVSKFMALGGRPCDAAVQAAVTDWAFEQGPGYTRRLSLLALLKAGGCVQAADDYRLRMYSGRHAAYGAHQRSATSVLGLAILEEDDELLGTALAAGANPDAQATTTDISAWHAAARLNKGHMIVALGKAEAASRHRRRRQLVNWAFAQAMIPAHRRVAPSASRAPAWGDGLLW